MLDAGKLHAKEKAVGVVEVCEQTIAEAIVLERSSKVRPNSVD